MDLMIKGPLPDIFKHKFIGGGDANTLELLNAYMQRTFEIALQDIADRNFTVSDFNRKDMPDSKSVDPGRSLADLRKALKLKKDDYFYYHSSTFMAYYKAIFVELNRGYWRAEKKEQERKELSKKMNEDLKPFIERMEKRRKEDPNFYKVGDNE
jgi:hypothetical protein